MKRGQNNETEKDEKQREKGGATGVNHHVLVINEVALLLLSLFSYADKDVQVANSQEKETCHWRSLVEAFRAIYQQVRHVRMLFTAPIKSIFTILINEFTK